MPGLAIARCCGTRPRRRSAARTPRSPREIVLALPADRALSTEDRIELARSFAQEHFVSKGLAVQIDVHAPHQERGESEGASAGTGGDASNWHAHLLITTRRIEGDRLARQEGARPGPGGPPRRHTQPGHGCRGPGARPGGRIRTATSPSKGIALRVDATAAHPGEHIGPVRMRKVDSPAVERAEALRTANEAAARDPEQVLAALTRNKRDVHRAGAGTATWPSISAPVRMGTPDAAQVQDIAAVKAAVMGHKDVLVLHDRETGEAAGRFQHADGARTGARGAGRRGGRGRDAAPSGRESTTPGGSPDHPHAAG